MALQKKYCSFGGNNVIIIIFIHLSLVICFASHTDVINKSVINTTVMGAISLCSSPLKPMSLITAVSDV